MRVRMSPIFMFVGSINFWRFCYINSLDYVVACGRLILNKELGKPWEGAIVTYFNIHSE
jgi:hypothetical protein